MQLRSLSNKILLTMVAVILIMSAAFLIYFIVYMTEVMELRAREDGLAAAASLAQNIELGVITEEERFLRDPFKRMLSDPNVAYVVAYDKTGRIVGSDAKVTIDPSLPPSVMQWMEGAKRPLHVDSPVGGLPDAIDYYAPVVVRATTREEAVIILGVGEEVAMPKRGTLVGIVRIGMSGADIALARRRVLLFGITVVLMMFLIAIMAVLLLGRHFTRPLVSLREGASRIARGELGVHIPVRSHDEIGELASSFNQMTTELQKTTVSKNYVDNILGSMVDTLVVLDSNGNIQMVNAALLRLLGYREQDLVGQSFTTILQNAGVLNGPAWRRFRETGTIKNYELKYVTRTGEAIPMNFNGSLMPESSQGVYSIVGVAHDVREVKRLMIDIERKRRETEQARYEAEFQQSRLTFLLAALNEGVVMFDPKGEIVVVNPMARRFFRFGVDGVVSREKLRGVPWLNVDEALSEVGSEGVKTVVREAEIDFPVPQVIRSAFTDVRASDGRLLGILLVLQDITEERQLDSMRDEFVITVSHDLRTPLTTIKGFVGLLLNEKVGTLSEKQRKFLSHVDESTQHLHALINDLLDLSRIHSGKLVANMQEADVRAIAGEAVNLHQHVAGQKGVHLNLVTGAEPCLAKVDAERIKEALNNLIGNALKFTMRDGKIVVEVLDHSDDVEVQVRDTGDGIGKEDLEVIFEKFRSIPGKGDMAKLSTGIGLSIVRGIVNAHRGKVWVESEKGKGSTFYIRFPKKPTAELK